MPRSTPAHLQLDIEQEPYAENAVGLTSEVDRYGRPQAAVRWKFDAVDLEHIKQAKARIVKKWPGPALGLSELKPCMEIDSDLKPHGAYHPVGMCRMGTDCEAVVDPHLRVCGVDNLFVLSTSVFSTAGTANPTFSMLCLGDRLADDLYRLARSSG